MSPNSETPDQINFQYIISSTMTLVSRLQQMITNSIFTINRLAMVITNQQRTLTKVANNACQSINQSIVSAPFWLVYFFHNWAWVFFMNKRAPCLSPLITLANCELVGFTRL